MSFPTFRRSYVYKISRDNRIMHTCNQLTNTILARILSLVNAEMRKKKIFYMKFIHYHCSYRADTKYNAHSFHLDISRVFLFPF